VLYIELDQKWLTHIVLLQHGNKNLCHLHPQPCCSAMHCHRCYTSASSVARYSPLPTSSRSDRTVTGKCGRGAQALVIVGPYNRRRHQIKSSNSCTNLQLSLLRCFSFRFSLLLCRRLSSCSSLPSACVSLFVLKLFLRFIKSL
jgi:hypothetical protein